MYNIHSHYETIFHALKNIVAQRRVFYLHPFGATHPENIESITDKLTYELRNSQGPLLLFYDQEPVLGKFNYPLFDYLKERQGPYILVTTEKESTPLDHIKEKYQLPSVYYFHHAFAAHDWFRGYKYDARLVAPVDRKITKKFISFNRITSSLRAYRSLLLAELSKLDLVKFGHVSYNDTCVEGGSYQENLLQLIDTGLIDADTCKQAIDEISKLELPLRIDYKQEQFIPNHSFMLSAVEQTQESFCYLVTETCFWERKHHLTEKIFKPIVSKMPFVLAGPAHNLKYLREYGFKTFSPWIDESYDDVEDPVERIKAIGKTIEKICSYSDEELYNMLQEMIPVLEHNYNRFYSNEFLDYCWDELMANLTKAINEV